MINRDAQLTHSSLTRFLKYDKLLKIENDHLVLAVFISFALRCTSQITAARKIKEAVASTLKRSVPSRSVGKEGPSGRPERAESQSIREEEGKGKKRRDKEKEQPAQVLEKKKGIKNQIRHFLLLRIQFSAKVTSLWCLFLSLNHLSAVIQTYIFPFGAH